MYGTIFQVGYQVGMARKRGRWEPAQIFNTQLMCYIENLVCQQIAITKMMVSRYSHPIPDIALYQCFF